MATLIVHGTVPVKASFTVTWWWDSWHKSGFLDSMAKAMQAVSATGQDDVWKINGEPVARIDALDPQGPSGWKAALDPNAWLDLMDPRRLLDAEQYLVHKGCFMWSGSDMDSERQRAGRALARYLNRIHALAPHEPIRIVAHSHGCNVVKVASGSELLDPAIFIERAAFLACPHFVIERGGHRVFPYRLDPARVGRILNAYSLNDTVQVDIAQNMPGPPENTDMIMGIPRAKYTEQDPAAQSLYRNLKVATEDRGVPAHGAMHGSRMGELIGCWLNCKEDRFDERYCDETRENCIFTIAAGDDGD